MQALEVIQRNNAKAVEEYAIRSRAEGKFGLAKYSGLNFFAWAEFDTERERNAAALAWTNESAGNTIRLINPNTPVNA